MLTYLTDLIARLGHWGYLIVFAVATAESAAFLGLVVPGESVVLVSGFLAAKGVFDLDTLIVTVAVAAVLGDNIGYELGRRLGRPWLLGHGGRFGLDDTKLTKADDFFSRHGGNAVFLGRFVGFARALVPFVAGSTRMRYTTFLVYNAIGAALWSAGVVLLGYFVGRAAERWIGEASAVLGGIALGALGMVLLWRWLAEREDLVRERWTRFMHTPAAAWARRRFAPLLAWTRRRLTPGGYFGLQLTLGVLLFVGAAWLFGGIAEDVVHGDPLTVFDRRAAAWFAAHATPRVHGVMSAIRWLHTWPLALLGIGFLLHLAWHGRWRWTVVALLVVPGGLGLNAVVKLAIHRAQPTLSGLSAVLGTDTFPSGRTVAATLVYGLIAGYLISRPMAWRWRVATALSAVFVVGLVGLSGVYLGVDYPSDVLAAMAEGVAWLTLCYVAVTTLGTDRGAWETSRQP
jgi:undecaprenyl-diphosphatase